jgi:UDP-N-acetyl-D-galactosamine dehydrogenase
MSNVNLPDLDALKVGVVGLGYVGLPLAAAMARSWPVVAFDINPTRIRELKSGNDRTGELSADALEDLAGMAFTSHGEDLRACNLYIVTVPTPVDDNHKPDLGPLKHASRTVGGVLAAGDIVVYESTVYPGCTEEVCVPILEELSGLSFNRDFTVGYSPERINPGDKSHRVESIAKVVSGSTPETAELLERVYGEVVSAGVHRVSSIRVAEAAKVIENTQRDVNIALINELAMIFNKLGIDSLEVLEAAGTKWNFLPFRPGLVGGHCISVDPYYLTHKTEEIGYHAQMILAGRRINDQMGSYVALELLKLMIGNGHAIKGSRVLVLGLTFKENCPDIRNTRVVDVIKQLEEFGVNVDVHDPWVDDATALEEYGLAMMPEPDEGAYDGIVLAVAHDVFVERGGEALREYGTPKSVLYDVKSALPREDVDGRL